MTNFEQELVRAIEHGCPKCGDDYLTLWCIEERGYHLGTDGNGEVLHYEEYDSFASSEDNEVWCRQCDSVLWTAESGWIPELADIVKGEPNATER